MSLIKGHYIEEENGKLIIVVNIDPKDAEFAKSLTSPGNRDQRKTKEQILQYIKNVCPDLNVSLCKVMLGAVLLATIPLGGIRSFAGARISTTRVNSYTKYKVTSGDTLWKIGKRFDTSPDDIKILNNLTGDIIYVGQILKIPVKSRVHEVQLGDNLWKIANEYNVTIDNIKTTNNLSTSLIYPGQKLLIPIKTSEVTKNDLDYIVKPGDSLWEIAKNYNISVDSLKTYNNLEDNMIYPSQVLKIPKDINESTNNVTIAEIEKESSVSYKTHYVQSGETIWDISIDYGVPMQELLDVNELSSNSSLTIGQPLKIPVHNIPVKTTISENHGELLDWWEEAQYVFPINKEATIIDFETGKTFKIKRTIGANHADCEPLTYSDTSIAKGIWSGFSWSSRPVLVVVDGRKIAGSMSFMPHGVQYIDNNNFNGHFDIHFHNSTRHKDGLMDENHQENIKVSAGIIK